MITKMSLNKNWIEKAVSENYVKYYDDAEFTNKQEIECGPNGKIHKANWKGTDTLLVLKSLRLNDEEIMNEVQ